MYLSIYACIYLFIYYYPRARQVCMYVCACMCLHVCICACLEGFSTTRQGCIFKRLVLIVATCDLPTTDVSYEDNSYEILCPAMRVTKNHIMRFYVLRCSRLPLYRKNIINKELAE